MTRVTALDALPPWLFRWGGTIFIAGLMLSRRPEAVLHPQFWAEDGKIFYHDAYLFGVATLWQPFGGYLNTTSRLVALLAVKYPLTWSPALYVAFASAAQLLPVWLLLSPRLAVALPSRAGALSLACFYAGAPNNYELNLNLTNAQWHLAMAAFLVLAAAPVRNRFQQAGELALLALSGLSGPFGIFLVPLAWWDYWQRRAAAVLGRALALSVTAAVQLGFIILMHGAATRSNQPLGVSLLGLDEIVTNQILLGGLIGYHLMDDCLTVPLCRSVMFFVVVPVTGILAFACAWGRGPALLRRATVWAVALFAGALVAPLSLTWGAMAMPGIGLRYFDIPSLVWFAALISLVEAPVWGLRLLSRTLLAASLLGAVVAWHYPAFIPTDFNAQARAFAQSPANAVFVFPENRFPPVTTVLRGSGMSVLLHS